jgi:hypothetical protein
MQDALLSPLATWQNFYVIVGTAAATLTGLMFVVITLSAQLRVQVSLPRSGIAVFTTPNVFHFGAALLVAAIFSAPWPALWPAGLLLGLLGLAGVTYILIVLWLARHRLPEYQMVRSDWLWYTVLPLVSYTALVVAALVLPSHPVPALFVIAAGTMLLLYIGIHNAWDVVTYTPSNAPSPRTRARTSRSLAPVGFRMGKCCGDAQRGKTLLVQGLQS